MTYDRSTQNQDVSRRALVDELLNDQSHHIEFNGHLSNHNKHAVVAFNGLGASPETIKSYYDAYAALTAYGYGLEAPKISKYLITEDNWKLYLGKRTSYSSYCQFFERQEKELGMKELLKRYIPLLLPGWVGSLSHGTIHLGWALDVNHRWMTIEGLAYMAFSYVTCHPERSSSVEQIDAMNSSVLDALFHLAGAWETNSVEFNNWVEAIINADDYQDIHPELIRSGLQYRIAKFLAKGHPFIYMNPSWIDEQDLTSIWKQLHYAITLLYMTKPGDFLILHLITALHGLEHITRHMPVEQQRFSIKCLWIGMLCILFSRGEFPKRAELEALNAQYQDAIDTDEMIVEKSQWEQIISRALCDKEEHNAKMVYVLRRMWEISGYRSIFRVAANYFTTTPELPKSFELPPIE